MRCSEDNAKAGKRQRKVWSQEFGESGVKKHATTFQLLPPDPSWGYRIEDKRKRAPRLPSMLRADGEEDDAALPHRDFDERGFARKIFFAEQPAGTQHVFVRVARDDADALRVCDLKCRTVDEVGVHVFAKSARERVRSINSEAQD